MLRGVIKGAGLFAVAGGGVLGASWLAHSIYHSASTDDDARSPNANYGRTLFREHHSKLKEQIRILLEENRSLRKQLAESK